MAAQVGRASTRTTGAPALAPASGLGGENISREDAIRQRAHRIYQYRESANQPGDAVSDWLQAERELFAEPVRTSSPRD